MNQYHYTALVDSNTFDFDVKWNAYDTVFTSLGTQIADPHIEEKLQKIPLYDEEMRVIVERNHVARLPYQRTIQNIAAKYPRDPIYLFGYDWRLSNAENGKRLATYVQYLKEKLRGKRLEGFRFITHSMGGLVFSCYLTELNGNYDDIDKVILCAPPFRGSPYALIHMVKGDGGLKSFLNKVFGRNDDIRKVVRTYPSIFELLPWYDVAIVFEGNNKPVDLTNLDHWQSNIWDDIEPLFKERLRALTAFRTTQMCDLATLPFALRSKMIIAVGSDDNTLTNLQVGASNGKIKFHPA